MKNSFNPVTTKVKMLQNWNEAQFKAMKKAIAKHFNQRVFLHYKTSGEMQVKRLYNSFSQVYELLGLAYTSTGIFACYGVCNVQAYFDADCIYQYSYFTIGENGTFYAILQDVNENELCIEL